MVLIFLLTFPTALSPSFDHTHAAWTSLLERYVHDGSVDYAGLGRSSGAALDDYLATLSAVDRGEYAAWNDAERLAFWINAYNAFTVRLILDNYPLKSIRSIGLLPGAAFRKSFIRMQSRGDKPLSLNDIEHEILRKEFSEPRIHFAIVCASVSCPILRSEAYVATRLETQLASAASGFLADTERNRYDEGSDTLHLSSIFDWFADDFEKASGSVAAFVKPLLPPAIASRVRPGTTRVRFLEYDWSLNGR